MSSDLVEYASLGFSAFTSASLLPGTSEMVLALLWYQKLNIVLLWCVATAGNVAGSLLNYWLGLQCQRFSSQRWFPIKPAEFNRAQHWMTKFGTPILMFSWLPVVGDPLTLMAGVFRLPLWRFLLLMVLAKGGRYAALLYFADEFLTPWIHV
jgi:membrane protein YqaA with SNARE-associated domain